MPDWLAIVLRPFGLLVLLLTAALLSRSIERYIPDGRVKRLLYRRHSVVPEHQTRRNLWLWRCVLIAIVLAVVFKVGRFFQ